jgi:N-alpha-acetyltransferase 30
VVYSLYEGEHQLPAIMELVSRDLSEPYSIFTFRYFVHNWSKLCIRVREAWEGSWKAMVL